MSKLIPMTQTEYDAFLERSIPEYAAEHVRAGNWLESESLETSRKEFEKLLPQGLNSEDNFLYTLYDGDDAVGMIWVKLRAILQKVDLFMTCLSKRDIAAKVMGKA